MDGDAAAARAERAAQHVDTWAASVLTEERFEAALRRTRSSQGVGVDGWSAYLMALSSSETRTRYLDAMRGVATEIELATAEAEAATSPEARLAAEADASSEACQVSRHGCGRRLERTAGRQR